MNKDLAKFAPPDWEESVVFVPDSHLYGESNLYTYRLIAWPFITAFITFAVLFAIMALDRGFGTFYNGKEFLYVFNIAKWPAIVVFAVTLLRVIPELKSKTGDFFNRPAGYRNSKNDDDIGRDFIDHEVGIPSTFG